MIIATEWQEKARARIGALPLFHECAKPEKLLIASLATAVGFYPGETILPRQELPGALVLVLDGTVALYDQREEDRAAGLLPAGAWLGHAVPFFSQPFPYKLVAVQPSVIGLLLWNSLEHQFEMDASLGYRVLKGMARFLAWHTQVFYEIKSNTPRGKLLRLLVEFGMPITSDGPSHQNRYLLPFTPREVALLVNMDEDEVVSLAGLL